MLTRRTLLTAILNAPQAMCREVDRGYSARWISVVDRLPPLRERPFLPWKSSERVLVSAGGFVTVANLYDHRKGELIWTDIASVVVRNVSHWTYLPRAAVIDCASGSSDVT